MKLSRTKRMKQSIIMSTIKKMHAYLQIISNEDKIYQFSLSSSGEVDAEAHSFPPHYQIRINYGMLKHIIEVVYSLDYEMVYSWFRRKYPKIKRVRLKNQVTANMMWTCFAHELAHIVSGQSADSTMPHVHGVRYFESDYYEQKSPSVESQIKEAQADEIAGWFIAKIQSHGYGIFIKNAPTSLVNELFYFSSIIFHSSLNIKYNIHNFTIEGYPPPIFRWILLTQELAHTVQIESEVELLNVISQCLYQNGNQFLVKDIERDIRWKIFYEANNHIRERWRQYQHPVF